MGRGPPEPVSRRDTPLADAGAPPALAQCRHRFIDLLPALVFHVFGALTWVVSLGFSSDIGSGSQANEAFLIGAATWLVAALLIVGLWWSGKSPKVTVLIPFAWWLPSFLPAIYVVY
jgi:hypothetical protein